MHSPDGLIVRPTSLGKGVFATRLFQKGEMICVFQGEVYTYESLPKEYDEHCLQLDDDLYQGSSGEIDDYFNHSCEPNAGLRFEDKQITLITLRAIQPDEEITWDYSTDSNDENWEMQCLCGSIHCRKIVKAFQYLPLSLRKHYAHLGIVPPFLLKSLPLSSRH